MSQPPYPPFQPDDPQAGTWPPAPPGYPPMASTPPYGGGYAGPPEGEWQQPYGAPWSEQQYGYPGQPPYGEPPRRGNGMAVAGFVLSFFFGLLGLIFSVIGLRRSREPGRSGRGLAIAGIVISVLNVLLGILIAVGMSSGTTSSGGSLSTAAGAPSGTAGSLPAAMSPTPLPATTVVGACQVIVPAVAGAQADLQRSSSVSDMLNKVQALADRVQQEGVATGDSAFEVDTANLADQYRALLKAAESGQPTDTTALAKAGEQVGYDCGRLGVAP